MALKSNLFRGDPKLEEAAINAAAHIMRGARGEHVAKIQYALSVVAGEPLKLDGQFGPKTAAAVLSFKQRWCIINRSYQSQPDDIVGVMTIATLDGEIFSVESSGRNARLISCTYRRAPYAG